MTANILEIIEETEQKKTTSIYESVEYDENKILEEILAQDYASGMSFRLCFKHFLYFLIVFDIFCLLLKGIAVLFEEVPLNAGAPSLCVLCALGWILVSYASLERYWIYSPFSKLVALNSSLRSLIRIGSIVLIVSGFIISYLQSPIYRSLYGEHFLLNRVYDICGHTPYLIIGLGISLLFIKFVAANSEKEYQMKLLQQATGWAFGYAVRRTQKIYSRTHPELQAAAASTNTQKGDAGEKAVNYKLRWWEESKKARDPSYHVLSIQYDCQSQYSNACIRLAAPHVAQGEPQEFDHLLVTSAGVIAIETKTYSGTIEVVSDGTWKLNGQYITSPNSQVERHHVVLFNILKKFQVPIHSVICIADSNSVIVGATNSSIPIVSIRDLESYLNSIQIHTKIPEDSLWQIFRTINNAKVGRAA